MRWILACVIGEAIGIAFVSVGYSAADRWFPVFAPALILGTGAIEGLSLGCAQSLAARRYGIRFAPWVSVTVAAALLGYGLSLIGQGAFSGAAVPASSPQEPPFYWIAVAGAGLGAFMGLLFGAAQSLVLPAQFSKRSWIIRNVIGWTAAMSAIMVAASLAGADWPLWRVALLGCASGAIAGLALGVATRGAFPLR